MAGGDDGRGTDVLLTSANLYDASGGYWTAAPGMLEARLGYTATLLLDGTVLVAGGVGSDGLPAPAELYDPGSGRSGEKAGGNGGPYLTVCEPASRRGSPEGTGWRESGKPRNRAAWSV